MTEAMGEPGLAASTGRGGARVRIVLDGLGAGGAGNDVAGKHGDLQEVKVNGTPLRFLLLPLPSRMAGVSPAALVRYLTDLKRASDSGGKRRGSSSLTVPAM